jgi:hypothetical protein
VALEYDRVPGAPGMQQRDAETPQAAMTSPAAARRSREHARLVTPLR